ncbi:hypothetical protein MCOR25_009446 [Pyricularia grisea]|uniref:proline--tRNA ligase n=1 Tax=Pyricularia grisea TaxID=148305 RepID=A0A6P8ATN8_PYRGI|nr:uncharacterized protein PgNI_09900 [Pyricularia grisea]KAI6352377.1 hypothetical protein MCOR25_009446 [Pyricularia grisea]TLD05473.1 hypothetical protein PgNI_09900 [Pyricularia grisea]
MMQRLNHRACKPNLGAFCQPRGQNALAKIAWARSIYLDHRVRLQNAYDPAGGVTDKDRKVMEDAHEKLVRAGYLRQTNSGIFHLMPLGYRVQDKIMKLIERHMQSIGASRLALATLSSPGTWAKSGRFEKAMTELFLMTDRKGKGLLLSPTHEEEITTLVKQTLGSYKQLPARLYQITPKFRDEMRPRKGLLRGREFMMKDLYTFDVSVNTALQTYEQVRAAYDRIFSELRLPVMVAEASSGDIGGDLSHEYHLPTSEGEDDVISCSGCNYMANTEVAVSKLKPHNNMDSGAEKPNEDVSVWRAITRDKMTLVNVWYSESSDIRLTACGRPTGEKWAEVVNFHAVKRIVPDLDANVENVEVAWWNSVLANGSKSGSGDKADDNKPLKVINLVDGRLLLHEDKQKLQDAMELSTLPFAKEAYAKFDMPQVTTIAESNDGETLNLIKIRDGDACPKCDSGTLSVRKATELGHTFHLGDRYSEPMALTVKLPNTSQIESDSNSVSDDEGLMYSFSSKKQGEVNVQMGCHGIGVSRIIAAVAEHFGDSQGLNWPRAIAPYEVVIVTRNQTALADAESIYDLLSEGGAAAIPAFPKLDLVLDDRDKSLPWKLKDADLVGYPVVVVLGKAWADSKQCEVQCRQLSFKELVALDDLPSVVGKLLGQL